jgi:chromosome segregation protein
MREQAVEAVREGLEAMRLAAREVSVRLQTAAEQFAATGFELEAMRPSCRRTRTSGMGGTAGAARGRIERLGPINLASIDELKEQTERKGYLDAQLADLNDALNTLENAIRKIDRETRTRFKDTFDRVNDGMQELFPRLFGGGHAYLQLESEDLLEAGRGRHGASAGQAHQHHPPDVGRRESADRGGAGVRDFQLNPAPFCMLDEVDAPLDDANVGPVLRYSPVDVRAVQFIIITHNKTTMEMVNQLTGVTMHEPGVSRLVAVDIDEAVRMAAG